MNLASSVWTVLVVLWARGAQVYAFFRAEDPRRGPLGRGSEDTQAYALSRAFGRLSCTLGLASLVPFLASLTWSEGSGVPPHTLRQSLLTGCALLSLATTFFFEGLVYETLARPLEAEAPRRKRRKRRRRRRSQARAAAPLAPAA